MNESQIIQREIRIAARPETVFAFFTDPEKMVLWKGIAANLDPQPGGVYRVDVNGRDVARGEFVELVPYRRIVFTWGWEGENHPIPPGSSTVEITLTPDGDGTILRLEHRNLPSSAIEAHVDGWAHYLPRLAVAAAGGDPGPDPTLSTGMSPEPPEGDYRERKDNVRRSEQEHYPPGRGSLERQQS